MVSGIGSDWQRRTASCCIKGQASYSDRWQTTAIQGTMRFRVAPLLFKAHAPIQSSATRPVDSTAGELYTLRASTPSAAKKSVKLTFTIYCCEEPRRQRRSLARGVHGTVRFLSIHGNYSALHWIIVSQKWHLGHRQMRSQRARFFACCQPDFSSSCIAHTFPQDELSWLVVSRAQ